MAAIRHSIQKEVFSPSDERLLAIVSVTKSGGRKKRFSFLTLSGRLAVVCINWNEGVSPVGCILQ